MPLPTAADATVTAVPLSIAVLEARLMVGGAARPEQDVPVWQATVGGGISSEFAGSESPPTGHPTSVGLVQANCVAWKVTCQPSPLPVESVALYAARVV
jgi:hypothetical protein